VIPEVKQFKLTQVHREWEKITYQTQRKQYNEQKDQPFPKSNRPAILWKLNEYR
jgi:hypothetical protein